MSDIAKFCIKIYICFIVILSGYEIGLMIDEPSQTNKVEYITKHYTITAEVNLTLSCDSGICKIEETTSKEVNE